MQTAVNKAIRVGRITMLAIGLIAFHTNRDGNFEVYAMNRDGSGQTNLTDDPAGDFTPDW